VRNKFRRSFGFGQNWLLTYGATFGYGRKWKNDFRSVSSLVRVKVLGRLLRVWLFYLQTADQRLCKLFWTSTRRRSMKRVNIRCGLLLNQLWLPSIYQLHLIRVVRIWSDSSDWIFSLRGSFQCISCFFYETLNGFHSFTWRCVFVVSDWWQISVIVISIDCSTPVENGLWCVIVLWEVLSFPTGKPSGTLILITNYIKYTVSRKKCPLNMSKLLQKYTTLFNYHKHA